MSAPLTILANVSALIQGNTTQFSPQGGVSPYAFSVIPDGVGGTINATTGLYTAPSSGSGTDVVQLADANGGTTVVEIFTGTALELVCDIIQEEMGLEDDQVYLYNQKFIVPSDARLYIPVGVLSCKPFANMLSYDGNVAGLDQVQSTNFMATLSVDIMSRSIDALMRKEEVLLALGSTYAQAQQEVNGFFIARISSSFQNLSEIDGAAIPYRFNITVNIQYSISKRKSVSYFDTFQNPSVTVDS